MYRAATFFAARAAYSWRARVAARSRWSRCRAFGLARPGIRPRRDLHVLLVIPLQSCRLAGGGRAFNPFRMAPPSIKGRRLSDPEVPTKLAHLSVIRAGLAIAHSVSVHASLVGSGIGGADTGIFGVCLCWWNAEGCQCYGYCRRHAY